MFEDGVGKTKVAFGILEVDGVDLVRHGTGTYFASLDFLLEILHGDIGPDVTTEVDEDNVDTLACIEPCRHHVIVLNLRGELLAFKPKALFNKSVAERTPVDVRECYQMSVEMARSAAEFGSEGNTVKFFQLPAQTVGIDTYLLAQRGGRSRLTMGMCQHGDVLPFLGTLIEHGENVAVCGHQHLFVALFHRKWHGCVVNVLRGKSKMDEFLE